MLKSSLKDSLKMSEGLQFPLKEKATFLEQNWAMTLLKDLTGGMKDFKKIINFLCL